MKAIIVAITLSMVFTGCQKPNEVVSNDGHLDFDRLEKGCRLNIAAFVDILERDLDTEIKCLETNIKQYLRWVKRKNKLFISRLELIDFVSYFFDEDKSLLSKLFTFFFNINMLLEGDPKDLMSVYNVDTMFNIIRGFNYHGRAFYSHVMDLDEDNYWELRSETVKHINGINHFFIKLVEDSGQEVRHIRLKEILESVRDLVSLVNDEVDLHYIENFLFIKKLLLGGSNTILSSGEFKIFLGKLTDLTIVYFDSLYVKDSDQLSLYYKIDYYRAIVSNVKSSLANLPSDEVILNQKQLKQIMESFFESSVVLGLTQTIMNLKKRLWGREVDLDVYRFKTLQKFLSWMDDILKTMYFNAIIYERNRDIFDSFSPLLESDLDQIIRDSEEDYLFPFKQDNKGISFLKLWAQLKHIGLNYRYYSELDNNPYFFYGYRRSSFGLVKISLFRGIIQKLFEGYSDRPTKDNLHLELDANQVESFLKDLKPAFIEYNLWPENVKEVSGLIVLFLDSFQNQSNGNQKISIDELTEYLNLLGSLAIKGTNLYVQLGDVCLRNKAGHLAKDCFVESFSKYYFENLEQKRNYPELYEHYISRGKDHFESYLNRLFSYKAKGDRDYISQFDVIIVLNILSLIETIYFRFDKNEDGLLSYGELYKCYGVYAKTLAKYIPSIVNNRSIRRSAYLYILNYGKIPNITKLMKFHLFFNKNRIIVTRENFSKIIYEFSSGQSFNPKIE